ncbi:hypothetical protein EDB85DRAFT_1819238, partial [Lactarius pseudohatsudake]
ASSTPDSVIDPALLDISHTHYSYLVDPSVNFTGQDPPTPTPLQSPITSTSSLFGPMTPREDLYSEPDVHRPEQGTLQLSSRFFQAPQARVAPIAEDPIRAATLLLQALISAPSQAIQSKAQSQPPPSHQRRPSRASPGGKALNKQEIIQRAKERRQQLIAELERAKVELWEATIEQGVLSHLVKDH